MKNMLLREARRHQGWSQQQLADFAEVSLSTIERAERGEAIRIDNVERVCSCLQKSPEQLGLLHVRDDETNKCSVSTFANDPSYNLFTTQATGGMHFPSLNGYWNDELLTTYANGIAACQDLYYNGNSHQVEAILPLYSNQTALLAQQVSPLQQAASGLASHSHRLICELAIDREDFQLAQHVGQQAFAYAKYGGDLNLQVTALISLANRAFHLSTAEPDFIRKHSKDALHLYQYAISLSDEKVTPLLKGRTYAGIAEVYAMRGQLQEAMMAMGLAYEHYPLHPEDDPAYPYLRASRYSLYVFGDAQSRLFLKQPEEAEQALIAMQNETRDPEIEPITRLDLLYYQAEIQIQRKELEASYTLLEEAALLAKNLGSRLYFNKLVVQYHVMRNLWSAEHALTNLHDVFQAF